MADHPPADLVSRIADTQAEFQRVADIHRWVCLDIPPLEGNNALPIVGPPGERHPVLDYIPHRLDPMLLPVLDRVNDLTRQAQQLLMQVLATPNSIPADTQAEIREWENHCCEYGWIRWLWYATPMHYVGRIMNYPQVAANALGNLKDHLLATRREPAAEMLPEWMAARDLATFTGLSLNQVNGRLARYKENHTDCYMNVDNPRKGAARIMYRTREVLPILQTRRDKSPTIHND
jgi:hypothetical protein